MLVLTTHHIVYNLHGYQVVSELSWGDIVFEEGNMHMCIDVHTSMGNKGTPKMGSGDVPKWAGVRN